MWVMLEAAAYTPISKNEFLFHSSIKHYLRAEMENYLIY